MDKELLDYLEHRFQDIEYQLKTTQKMLFNKLQVKQVINTRVSKIYEAMQIEDIIETPEGVIIKVR